MKKFMYVYKNNCNCLPTVKPTNIAIVDGTLQITMPSRMTLLNGKAWNFIICQNIPRNAGEILPVEFIVNGTTYPLLCRLGNRVFSDSLRCRTKYILSYGWDNPHFIILSKNLCESAFVPTTATTPTPAPANVVNGEQS